MKLITLLLTSLALLSFSYAGNANVSCKEEKECLKECFEKDAKDSEHCKKAGECKGERKEKPTT